MAFRGMNDSERQQYTVGKLHGDGVLLFDRGAFLCERGDGCVRVRARARVRVCVYACWHVSI